MNGFSKHPEFVEEMGVHLNHKQQIILYSTQQYVFECYVAWLLRGQECIVGPGEGVGCCLVRGLACELGVGGGGGGHKPWAVVQQQPKYTVAGFQAVFLHICVLKRDKWPATLRIDSLVSFMQCFYYVLI